MVPVGKDASVHSVKRLVQSSCEFRMIVDIVVADTPDGSIKSHSA